MNNDIVLATNNQGKQKEIQALLQNLPLTIHAQAEFDLASIPETGLTFVENALLKARHVAFETKLPSLADDSGLVVPALQGEPGIYSARYAGPQTDSAANNQKLLQKLKQTPNADRQAYFYCVMVLITHAADPMPIICQGIWRGSILDEPRGTKGFGYDPIFFVPTHNCSAAELAIAEKNKISHRGQALQQLVARISDKIGV